MARGVDETGPHPVDLHVGRRVAERRISMGYNQSDLGRALGLTFQQVQKYEKGTNRISASKLWLIAHFLGVPMSYFFDGLETADTDVSLQPTPPAPAPTRYSVEIGATLPTLAQPQQKLVLELVRQMAAVKPQIG